MNVYAFRSVLPYPSVASFLQYSFPQRDKIGGMQQVARQQLRVGRVVAQQALTFENLPKNRLRRFIDIHNVHRTTKFGAYRFDQLPLKAIAYRRIGHNRQIDIAAKVFLPLRICLRTEQYRQPYSGIA